MYHYNYNPYLALNRKRKSTFKIISASPVTSPALFNIQGNSSVIRTCTNKCVL